MHDNTDKGFGGGDVDDNGCGGRKCHDNVVYIYGFVILLHLNDVFIVYFVFHFRTERSDCGKKQKQTTTHTHTHTHTHKYMYSITSSDTHIHQHTQHARRSTLIHIYIYIYIYIYI